MISYKSNSYVPKEMPPNKEFPQNTHETEDIAHDGLLSDSVPWNRANHDSASADESLERPTTYNIKIGITEQMRTENKAIQPIEQRLSLVCEGEGDNRFDDKQERKVYARRNRAAMILERLKHCEGRNETGHRAVHNEHDIIRTQWPALFGHPPSIIYAHLDLDAFFASVEVLDNPEYANVPFCVGTRMMIATANYHARKYGVRAGMAGYRAKQLCPNLIFQKPNMKKYKSCSDAVINILSQYDPEVEVYGLDEVCMGFDEAKLAKAYFHYNNDNKTGMNAIFKAPVKTNGLGNIQESQNSLTSPLIYRGFGFLSVNRLVEKLRHIIFRNTGLTISSGISVCRGLAKYSSNIKKPNGQFTLDKDFDHHILKLPADKMNGIGKATKEVLEKAFQIVTLEDLRSKLHLCAVVFKPKTFSYLARLSYGLSHHDSLGTSVLVRKPALSHGISLTVPPTTSSKDVLFYLWEFSKTIHEKVRHLGKASTAVTLTIKFASFDTLTKRISTQPIKTQIELFEHAISLVSLCFTRVGVGRWAIEEKIRLLGLTIGGFVPFSTFNIFDKFTMGPAKVNPRVCIICNAFFIHESQIVYESHVNNCLDTSSGLHQSKQRSLLDYFNK